MSYNVNEWAPSSGRVINSQGELVNVADVITPDGKVKIDLNEAVELTVSDIQIGAVEVKDEETNARLKINSDGSINVTLNQPQGSDFTFEQSVPATTWNIIHMLNKHPSITTVDSSGNVIEGQVVYNSDIQVTVYFSPAVAGTAYLN